MKRGPKLNLIKKFGKGGSYSNCANCEFSSKCILTKKLNLIKLKIMAKGGIGGTEIKTVSQTVSNEVK